MRPTQILLISFLFLAFFRGWGQTANQYSVTFTTGAAINPTFSNLIGSAVDDGISSVTNIGFNFVYEGITYSQFCVSSNGLMKLGSTGLGTGTWSNDIADNTTYPSHKPKIMPYWQDFSTGSNGSVAYGVSGSSPNRILVVRYRLRYTTNTTLAYNLDFQVRLYETSNKIEFYYASGASFPNAASCGIGGVTATNFISVTPSASPVFSSSVANNSCANWPSTNALYIFTPPVACSILTSAGTVSGNQTICSAGDPAAFTSTADASGGSGGTIGYQWESSTTSSSTGYSDIAGATSSTYDPPSGITTTTYYRRKARRCGGSWEQTTSVVIVTVTSPPSSVSAGVTTTPVCEGNSIALQGAGTGVTSWSWIGPNTFSSSLEDPTITNATTAASGTYFLTPSNSCGTGAGLFDDFSDNNFSSNPVWTPQTTTVLTTWSTGVNFLRGADTYSQEVISTPSTQVYGSWKFDFTMAAVDNSNHIVSFKFISSNAALSGDGYHVTVRGNATMSSSTIRLERFSGAQNPTAAGNTLLGSSYTWSGANTSAHTILVTRNTTGIFNVYFDGTLIITSLADLTYTSSTHAGFWTNSTVAATNHIMDNVACSDARVNVTVNQISATPTITSPICSGSTSVSGTSSEVTGSTVTVFKNGVSWGTTTTITFSNWTVTGTALAANDIITATVQASGKCVSNTSSSVTINLSNYRSKATGSWNDIATWEVSCDNGSTWSNATQTPTSSDGTITIRSPHTVTVAGAPTVDQVTVEAGGTVVVNTSALTIANGADAYDFIVQGTLITTDNTVDNITETGVLYFDNGGLYINNVNTANGYGTHPTATWHLNSTCEVRGLSGSTLPNNFNQVYGNLLWNCANQGTNAVVIEQANAPTVNGTMTVANTGTTGSLVFCNTTATGNWTTVNNLVVSGGNFYVAGVSSGFSSAVRDYKMSVNSLILTAGSLEVGRSDNQGVYSLTVNNNATLSGGLMRVMNNSGTGARVSSFFVNGNLTVSGATLDLSAIGSINAGRVFLKGDFTMSSGSLIFSQAMSVGSSGIYFDGATTITQNFIYSGGIISTSTGGVGRRFYHKNTSGPLGINETYNSSIAQTTVNGTEGSPSNAGSYVSWPTSGSLIKNLTINNSSGVTLTTSKTVNENLNLTNGILSTSSTNLLYLANTSSSAIVGGSSTSFVNGPLKWAVTSGGGTYNFQIGKNGKYAPAGVVNPTASSTDFTAEYFNADPNTANYSRSLKAPTIDNVSACEYWTIDRTGSANANVILSWDVNARSCGINQPSELRVLRWESTGAGIWQDRSNSGFSSANPFSNGTITSEQITNFSPFTLGSTNRSSNPLPVNLSDFSATCIQDYVKLKWTTESEINNDYFEVERSENGFDFNSITRIDGNGTINVQQNYQYIDEQSLSGTSYYRLKQVDFDGKVEYFNPIFLDCKKTNNFSIYPNPNNGSFVVSGLSEDEEMQLTDALGRRLLSKKGEINYEINNLQEGIYFITIKNKFGLVQSQKIVVHR